MKNQIISIDGGGTKTEVCVYDENKKLMTCSVYEGININQIGQIKFTHIIDQIFNDINTIENARVCIGVPGYGESNETDRVISSVIYTNIKKENSVIINDVELAHYAAFALNDGLLLLSGTGSMLFYVNNSEIKRAGGWGYLIGDEGSSFYIGLKALNHISHVFDFNCKTSILSDIICSTYNFDFSSKLVNFVYTSQNYRKDVAKISLLVDEAAKNGCPVANKILEESADYFSEMISLISDHRTVDISYAGGTFKSRILREAIEKKGNCKLISPKMEPVLGGILKLLVPQSQSETQKYVLDLNSMYTECKSRE